MKLRNKKTGEIIDIKGALRSSDDYPNHYLISSDWEDIPEEPKEYWYMDSLGCITQDDIDDSWVDERRKQIGNYFETEEEAEKAVEKLKAFKRLKDKGFRFTGFSRHHWTGEEYPYLTITYPNFDDLFDDSETAAYLDLLFSQEDD